MDDVVAVRGAAPAPDLAAGSTRPPSCARRPGCRRGVAVGVRRGRMAGGRAGTRTLRRRGPQRGQRADTEAGAVLVGRGGRVAIATGLLNVQLVGDPTEIETDAILDRGGAREGRRPAVRAAPVRGRARRPATRSPRRWRCTTTPGSCSPSRRWSSTSRSGSRRPTPGTASSGSGTTPAGRRYGRRRRAAPRRPGTTPSARASASRSSTTASTPTTRTCRGRRRRLRLLPGRRARDLHVRHGRDARRRPRHLLRRAWSARAVGQRARRRRRRSRVRAHAHRLPGRPGGHADHARARRRVRRRPDHRGAAPAGDGRRHHRVQPRPERRRLGPHRDAGPGAGGAAANGRGGLGTAIFWAASNGDNVDVLEDEVGLARRRDRGGPVDPQGPGGQRRPRPEVELIAPGVDVVSTHRRRRLRHVTGTSFAAPCAAGCAALALSVRPALTPRRAAGDHAHHRRQDRRRRLRRQRAQRRLRLRPGQRLRGRPGRRPSDRARHRPGRFNDVPEGETTARSSRGTCEGVEDLTFEVTSGPTTTTGPADSFELLLGPRSRFPPRASASPRRRGSG